VSGVPASSEVDAMNRPIVCELTPAAIVAARARLLPGLAARADDRVETDNGYLLMFMPSSEIVPLIAEVINAERQCCRWLQFDLQIPPDGPIVLALSGPPGATSFLASLFNS